MYFNTSKPYSFFSNKRINMPTPPPPRTVTEPLIVLNIVCIKTKSKYVITIFIQYSIETLMFYQQNYFKTV